MVRRHVRVYIEGGATGRTADSDFRRGWRKFLNELHALARRHRYQSLDVVRGKGRGNAYRRFVNYKKEHPADLCVLLVDSEMEVPDNSRVWDIVARREGDSWARPAWATERHLYLMVRMVETWLLTDQAALQAFFKRALTRRYSPRLIWRPGLKTRWTGRWRGRPRAHRKGLISTVRRTRLSNWSPRTK